MEALAVERQHTGSRLPRTAFPLAAGMIVMDDTHNNTSPTHDLTIASSSNIPLNASSFSPPPESEQPQPLTTFPAELQPNSTNSSVDINTQIIKAIRRNAPTTARKENNGPPLSMITQGFYDTLSPSVTTSTWIKEQSEQSKSHPKNPPATPKTSRHSSTSIKPIRGFKPSSRRQSAEMERRKSASQTGDSSSTLRALEGLEHANTSQTNRGSSEEQNSDESDLFLQVANEEEQISQQLALTNGGGSPSRVGSRRSRFGHRGSFLPNNVSSPRRGSGNESSNDSRFTTERGTIGQALNYQNNRETAGTLDGTSRSRYYNSDTRSMPNTPRATINREISPPDSQASYGGRRPSIPDGIVPVKSPYRASNLSYSMPRTYNSSPLVSRTEGVPDAFESSRAVDGTESTVSTQAPSQDPTLIWDEVDNLKSRMRFMEDQLMAQGKVSRASNERPRTGTTTVTTISSSPKRTRANSFSPSEQPVADPATNEAIPLLQHALAKSKSVLSEDVFKALEATTLNALAIATMTGNATPAGLVGSSQSVIGESTPGADRQNQARSLCQNLTELCIALTDSKSDSQVATRPRSRDTDPRGATESINGQRQLIRTDLAVAKSSPRALSRVEQRRSSLLTTSNLPSPRYMSSEAGTPTQGTMAGRRTSLLVRSSRRGTEEPEDEDDNRFRAPSRAVTEINAMRSSPRQYTSQQPLPERQPPVPSSLPIRRHIPSTSLTNTAPVSTPPISALGGRRYLERSNPDHDGQSLAGKLAEDRGQRQSSISQISGLGRTTSLSRRTRQQHTASGDFSNIAPGSYQ